MFDHFVKFDTDGDGVISFTEFCAGFGVDLAAAEARTPTPEGTPSAAELYDVFCRIDSDGDKRVTGLEVATAIQEGTLLEWVRRLFRLLACTASAERALVSVRVHDRLPTGRLRLRVFRQERCAPAQPTLSLCPVADNRRAGRGQ